MKSGSENLKPIRDGYTANIIFFVILYNNFDCFCYSEETIYGFIKVFILFRSIPRLFVKS